MVCYCRYRHISAAHIWPIISFFTNPSVSALCMSTVTFLRGHRGAVKCPFPSPLNWDPQKLPSPPPPWASPPVAPDWLFLPLSLPFIPTSHSPALLCENTLNDWIICFQTTLLCSGSFDRSPRCLAICSAHVAAPREPWADRGQGTKHSF